MFLDLRTACPVDSRHSNYPRCLANPPKSQKKHPRPSLGGGAKLPNENVC
jgi:hypothetical protein